MRNGTRRRVQAPVGAVVAGQTYHVAGTWDGPTRLYVNGVQVASATFSGAVSVNTARLAMGAWDTASEFLPGVLDEVATYANVLTPARITAQHTAGKGAP